MTDRENIKAILECYFAGFKEEIIDNACNRILEQKSEQVKVIIEIDEKIYDVIKSDLYNTFPVEWKQWGLEAIRNGTKTLRGGKNETKRIKRLCIS